MIDFWIIIILALILDAIFGEPQWLWRHLPHPVVLMGQFIDWMERNFNEDGSFFQRSAGILSMLIGCFLMWFFGYLLSSIPFIGDLVTLVIAAILISHKSLIEHLYDVLDRTAHSIEEGRRSVSRIVGRDTRKLDEPDVLRAAIESGAENFSDGVVAPVFWFILLGLPGILIFKFINTADSMIGYHTERYKKYGWAAARLDDVANFIPARIAALLISFGSFNPQSFIRALLTCTSEAHTHRSVNAGWPEAAMAGALDIALSGPRIYGDEQVNEPYLHSEGRIDITKTDLKRAINLLWKSWGLFVATLLVITFFTFGGSSL